MCVEESIHVIFDESDKYNPSVPQLLIVQLQTCTSLKFITIQASLYMIYHLLLVMSHKQHR